MILHLKERKQATKKKKCLHLINTFGNTVDTKVNIQKLVVFLYANNEQTEREIRKAIPLAIVSKNIKYLGPGAICSHL
jgi:hypothetical protein